MHGNSLLHLILDNNKTRQKRDKNVSQARGAEINSQLNKCGFIFAENCQPHFHDSHNYQKDLLQSYKDLFDTGIYWSSMEK